MSWLKNLDDEKILLFKFWLPALINGIIVWGLLLILGDTPLLRSSGLALVIVGVQKTLGSTEVIIL